MSALECYEYFCQGLKFEKEKEFTKASDAYKRALIINEDSVETHRALTRIWGRNPVWYKPDGDPQTAIQQTLYHHAEILRIEPADFSANLATGVACGDQSKWTDALHHFGVCVRRRPNDWTAHFNAGCACWVLDKLDVAVTHFQSAIFLKPDFVDAHFNLGNCFLKLSQAEEAAFHYGQVLHLSPMDDHALSNLAIIECVQLGDMDAGMEHFNSATEIDDMSFFARISKGACLLVMGKPSEAIEEFQLVYSAPEEEGDGWKGDPALDLLLAIAFEQDENYEEAITHLERCVAVDPKHRLARCSLGLVYSRTEQAEAATEQFGAALALGPPDAEVLCNFGIALEAQNRFSDAVTKFKEAIQLDPTCTVGHFALAGAMERAGRLEEAVSAYRAVLDSEPANGDALFKMGSLKERLMEFDEAETLLVQAIKANPADCEARLLMCRIMMANDRASEAAPQAEAVLAAGKNGEAMLTLVTAYEKLTRFDEANDMMDQLMDFAGRESEFLLKKVKLLARVERFDEALETVIECIEVDPDNQEPPVLHGTILMALGRTDEARAVLAAAAKASESFALFWQLGRCAECKEDNDEATMWYQKASKMKDHCECLSSLATLLKKARRDKVAVVETEVKKLKHEIININGIKAKRVQLMEADALWNTHLPTFNELQLEVCELFKRAVTADKADWFAKYNLGNTLLAMEKHAPAAMHMQKAIEIAMTNPDNLDTYELNALEVKLRTKLGQIFYEMEDTKGAAAEWVRCTDVNPDAMVAHLYLGILEMSKGDKMDNTVALDHFKDVLRADMDFAEAHFRMGACYLFNGQWDLVVEECLETIRCDEDYPSAFFILGFAQMIMGETNQAAKSFEMQLKYNPNHLKANYYLGMQYYAQGKKEEAAAQFEGTLALDPSHIESAYDLSIIRQESNKRAEAKELLQTVLVFEPCHKSALNNLGLNMDMTGEPLEAERLYNEAIRLDPNHSDALNNLGTNRNAAGYQDEAIGLYNKSIKVDTNAVAPHYNMAIALTKLDRRDDAIRHYQEVLVINSLETDAHFLLANAYDAQGKGKRAAQHRAALAAAQSK